MLCAAKGPRHGRGGLLERHSGVLQPERRLAAGTERGGRRLCPLSLPRREDTEHLHYRCVGLLITIRHVLLLSIFDILIFFWSEKTIPQTVTSHL